VDLEQLHLAAPNRIGPPCCTVRPIATERLILDLTPDDYATISDIAVRPAWQSRAACTGKGTE
jgi:hypothetical protein